MANSLSTYAKFLREGERVAQAITANAADLSHLETFREQLQGLVDAVRDLTVRQGAAAAEKQELTRQLQEAFLTGTQLMTYLRRSVQQVYGNGSEKLVEFGLVPFRGRAPRRPSPPAPAPEQPTPPPPVVE